MKRVPKMWNELRDERQLVALVVGGDQQRLGLFGFDAALIIGEGVLENSRKAVDRAIGFLDQRRTHRRLPARTTSGSSAGGCQWFRRHRRNHKRAVRLFAGKTCHFPSEEDAFLFIPLSGDGEVLADVDAQRIRFFLRPRGRGT